MATEASFDFHFACFMSGINCVVNRIYSKTCRSLYKEASTARWNAKGEWKNPNLAVEVRDIQLTLRKMLQAWGKMIPSWMWAGTPDVHLPWNVNWPQFAVQFQVLLVLLLADQFVCWLNANIYYIIRILFQADGIELIGKRVKCKFHKMFTAWSQLWLIRDGSLKDLCPVRSY